MYIYMCVYIYIFIFIYIYIYIYTSGQPLTRIVTLSPRRFNSATSPKSIQSLQAKEQAIHRINPEFTHRGSLGAAGHLQPLTRILTVESSLHSSVPRAFIARDAVPAIYRRCDAQRACGLAPNPDHGRSLTPPTTTLFPRRFNSATSPTSTRAL